MRQVEHMERPKNVTNVDCKKTVKISNDYPKHGTDFIKRRSKLDTMWYSPLGRIKAVLQWIGLLSADTRPINFAPYRARTNAYEFEKIISLRCSSDKSCKMPKPKALRQIFLHTNWKLLPNFAWPKRNSTDIWYAFMHHHTYGGVHKLAGRHQYSLYTGFQ